MSLKARIDKLAKIVPVEIKPIRLIYLKDGECLADVVGADAEADTHDNIVLVGVRPTECGE